MEESSVDMKRAWWSLTSLCLGIFVVLSSSTALNTMLNPIANDFGMSTSGVGWLVNSYWLITCALVVLGGQLGDRFGRRKIYCVGLIIFLLGLLVSALAIAGWMAILGRSLQGLGSAFVVPATVSIINVIFPAEHKSKAFAAWSTTVGLGTAMGPFLGGAITDSISWQAVFYCIMPLPILAFLLAMLAMPETQDKRHHRFDWAGVILLGLGVFMLVFMLAEGPALGWTSWYVLLAIALAIICIFGFFINEMKIDSPLVHLRHLKRAEVLVGNFATMALLISFIAVQYILNLYWQNRFTFGFTPLHAGSLLMALAIPYFLFSMFVGKFMRWLTQKWTVFWGMFLIGSGTMLFGLINPSSPMWEYCFYLALVGVGQGLATASSTQMATGDVPVEESGEASGINSIFRYFGGVLGVALGGMLYNNFSKNHVDALLAKSPLSANAEMVDAILVGSHSALQRAMDIHLMPQIKPILDSGLTTGLNVSLAIIGAVSIFAALLVPIAIRTKATKQTTHS